MRLLVFVAALAAMGCVMQAEPANETGCVCEPSNQSVCGNDSVTYESECLAGCAGAEVAYQGACRVEGCTDTDGGKNSSIKGTVSAGGLTFTDYCAIFDSVEEFYCVNSTASRESIGCGQGYECRNGACSMKPGAVPPEPCTDTDGRDLYTKGTVNGSGSLYNDSCQDHKLVKEYYCEDGKAQYEMNECPQGFTCQGGLCISQGTNCTDTDAGKNVTVEGKVTTKTGLASAEYLDKCLDTYTVREYYCTPSGYASEDIVCPQGQKCLSAACKEDLCTDSDDGFSIFQRGAANKGDTLKRDACLDATSGVEYFCDNNMILNATFECPAGYSCDDGKCED